MLFTGFVFFACCNEAEEVINHNIIRNEDDVVIDMKQYQWKIDVSDDDYLWGNLIPHRYKNTVILPGSKNESSHYILGVDIFTGEVQYKWLKTNRAHTLSFRDDGGLNQKDNLLLLQDRHTTMLFDLANGTEKWIKSRDMSQAFQSEIHGDEFYFSAEEKNNEDVSEPYIYKGQLGSGDSELITSPPIDKIQLFSNFYGSISPISIFSRDGDLFSLFGFMENLDVYNNNSSLGYVALYNLSKGEYVYDKKQVGDTLFLGLTEKPAIFDDVAVVNASDELFGIDLKTGETIWHRNEFRKGGEGTFVFQEYDGQFLGINVGGSVDRIVAINPETGKNNWEILGAGGDAETFQILDDKLFFVSRGTGRLYVYDLKSQKLLVEYESEDIDFFTAWGGMKPFIVDDRLLIVICTYLNAYCYDLSFLMN